MNFPDRHRLARYTKPLVLVGLAVVAYVAAISRAQALPWAMAALLSATLMVGYAWPRWLVRHLHVTRTGPEWAEEGETISFHVEVENHGLLPRFMVELVDRLPFVGAAKGLVAQGDQVLGVVAYVPGGGKRRFEMPLLCEKRGYYRLGPVSLASSFPLGLAEARQSRNAGVQTLTIYPDVFPIMALPLHGAPSQIHRGGNMLPEGAGAAEFSGLREYRRGDSPRHVHWPTTARLNELMVKEFEPLASACLYLALDLSAEADVGQGRQSTAEYAIRIAGSIARYGCSNGIRTRVVGHGEHVLSIPAATGDHHYKSILDELAVADASGDLPYGKVLEKLSLDCLPGETVLVFLSEPVARTNDTLQALALLRAKRAHLFCVVFDRDSFTLAQDAERDHASPGVDILLAGLLELGAHCVVVRRGDDLVRVFNS
jgi:uncharacterized protein (DUF58 family)